MKKSLFVMGILAFVFVFGIMVLGCSDDDGGGSGGDSDWVTVTSLAQINGTWKATDTQPPRTYEDSEDVTIRAEGEMTYIIIINASTKTITITETMTMSSKRTLSGSGSSDYISSYWNSMKLMEGTQTFPVTDKDDNPVIDENGNPVTETVTITIDETTHIITQTITVTDGTTNTTTIAFDESTHTITTTTTTAFPTQTFTNAQIAGSRIQISKDGTKLKFLSAPDDPDNPFSEMIFYKQ